MEEDRRRDVVGDVSDQRELATRDTAQVGLQDVGFDDIEPWIVRVLLTEFGRERAIYLDRHHARRTCEQLSREPTASGPNFDDGLIRTQPERVCDAREDARIAQEMLSQALSNRREGTAIALPGDAHLGHRSSRMRLPWQSKQPPLAVRIARTLERRGVGIQGLAVETHRGRATLRGVVTSDLTHDRAIEIARSVDGVERIDDLLSVVDPQTVRPRRTIRHEDCTAMYVTQAGDTLPIIAERVLGDRRRWRSLLKANRNVAGTGPLAPGLKIKIP